MKIAILGAGSVGATLAKLMCETTPVETVVVLDSNGALLEELEDSIQSNKLKTYKINIEKETVIMGLINGFDVLISALPSRHNLEITQLALKIGINYIDLGGRDGLFEEQKALHEQAQIAEKWVIPNCGLAPGMINVMVMHGFEEFDQVESIKIRAAGLPVHPVPPLNYQLGFSPIGLIEEYIEKPLIIQDGVTTYVNALDGYETLRFRTKPELGELESFYVSSRITTLARDLEGKVGHLDYKTVRYKGHRDIFMALFQLGFDSQQIIDIRASISYRDVLIRQIRRNMPTGGPDFVVVKVLVEGWRKGQKLRRDYELFHESNDSGVSAIMTCTALPVITMAELICQQKLSGNGGVFTPEHVVPKTAFLERLIERGLDIKITEEPIEE